MRLKHHTAEQGFVGEIFECVWRLLHSNFHNKFAILEENYAFFTVSQSGPNDLEDRSQYYILDELWLST